MTASSILRAQLTAAIESAGITVRWLDQDALSRVLAQVAQHAPGSGSALWERMGAAGSYDPDGWRQLCALIGDREIVLLGELGGGFIGLQLRGSDLEELLREAPLFVFYTTDLDGSFLAAFNDHDYLIIEDPAHSLAG
jgi:hypothetical protein